MTLKKRQVGSQLSPARRLLSSQRSPLSMALLPHSGVQSVKIEDHFAVTNDADGKVEHVELPVSLKLSNYGKGLILKYADGRSETRQRRQALATTKYGQPYAVRDLKGGKP